MVHHPKSGRRYTYVFPMAPAFEEMRASYAKLAETRPWLQVLNGPAGEARIARSNDPNELLVCFHRPRWEVLRQKRAAKVSFVYTEPLGPLPNMSADGRNYYTAFCSIMGGLDGVLTHTPYMRQEMSRIVNDYIPVCVLPAGLDPSATVKANFEVAKERSFLFYGANAGKRVRSLSLVSHRIHVAPNTFGRALGDLLNRSEVNVYVAHSDVHSFSTWRIWQTLATSAALAAEGLNGVVDAWPLEPWRHYAPLPQIMPNDASDFLAKLESVPLAQWREISLTARAEVLLKFTAERCVEDWLVPAGEAIFNRGK